MNAFTAEQNFRLQAIDWIDTFAEEIFSSEDSRLIEAVLDGEDSNY